MPRSRANDGAFIPSGAEGPDKLIGLDYQCECGRRHRIEVRHVEVGADILRNLLPALRKLKLTGRFALVFDKNIRPLAEQHLFPVLDYPGINYDIVCFDKPGELHGTVETSDELRALVPKDAKFLMVMGSGTMNDLTKWAATALDIPYVVIATAPSMNGYTSSISALSVAGFKTTQNIRPAAAVFADVNILKDAPIEMIRAGLGDLLSKNVCNADWRLSHLLRGTYFCGVPQQMTRRQEDYYLSHAAELGARDPAAVQMLTEAIMNSGFSMAIVGESSPSSGSEHLIAHYWEMMDDLAGQPTELHGARVGVGTLIAADLYERALKMTPADVDLARAKQNHKSADELRALVDRFYGAVAGKTFEETVKKAVPWDEKEKQLATLRDNWAGVWADVKQYLRPRAEIERYMTAAGCPVRARDLKVSRLDTYNAISYARLMRNRYTILDVADDLGWLEGWADELADEFAG